MENLAVMVPSTPAPVNNDVLSDESESESISLDLHVSDSEDVTEILKKDAGAESEDDILNKYADEETNLKMKLNGIIGSLCAEDNTEDPKTILAKEDKFEGEGQVKMDEDKLKIDEDTVKIDEDALKIDEDTVKSHEDIVKIGEDTVKIDEDTLKIDEDTAKIDEDTVKLGEITVKMEEDTVKMDEDAVKMDEDAVKMDEDAVNMDEDTVKMDEDTLKMDDDTIDKDLKQTDEIKVKIEEEEIEPQKIQMDEDEIERTKVKVEETELTIAEIEDKTEQKSLVNGISLTPEETPEEEPENKEDKGEKPEDRKEEMGVDNDEKLCSATGDMNESEHEETKKDDDEEDLLQVMETTFDEDNKDENSCSSLSEENKEESEENDENQEEAEDNQEEDEENPEESEDLLAENEELNTEDQEIDESMQVDEDPNHEDETNQEIEEPNQEIEEANHEIEEPTGEIEEANEEQEIEETNVENEETIRQNAEAAKEDVLPTEELSTPTQEEKQKEESEQKNIGEEEPSKVIISTADDDMTDCPMDIEESNIGGVIITEKIHPPLIAEKAMEVDVDANKENENIPETQAPPTDDNTAKTKPASVDGDDVVTLIDDDITDDTTGEKHKDEPTKKSTKRKQPDSIEEESYKKLKLDPQNEVKEKRQIKALTSFKDFMRDKKLKVLSRLELEEFCLQKMCEWIIDKSELAELRQKVKILEQTLDNWRKEAVTVAKQTRDLKIVHDRVIADLKLMKEQTGKPLVPVKITRSVGLQAVMDNNIRRPSLPNGAAHNVRVATNTNTVVNNVRNTIINKTPVRQTAVTQNKPSPQRNQSNNAAIHNKSAQPMPAKDTNNRGSVGGATPAKTGNQQTATGTTGTVAARKSTEAPKAVIDLTDDEEKTTATTVTRQPSVTLTPSNRGRANGQTSPVKTVATANGPTKHVMLMPTSMLTTRPVMLKVNPNIVSSANPITVPTSQVSIVTTQSKNGQVRLPVSSITPIRQTTTQKFKHPAPLPLPPPSQHHITGRKPLPPKPLLNLTRSACGTGIVLQWKMPYQLEQYEAIISYQLYAYQETKTPPRTDNWGKIGDVKALELPMAVTLTQFAVGNRYFFAVRAVDTHKRLGPFSDPQTILL